MKNNFKNIFVCLSLLWLIYFIISLPYGAFVGKSNEKYCHIDTIELVPTPEHEIIKEQTFKYHTDCNYDFLTKKSYNLGDSIKIKTIFANN